MSTNKPMEMTDLIPQEAKLTLAALPGKEITLRPFTLDDEIWLQNEYKGKFHEVFNMERPDMGAIARIAFRLIKEKQYFKILMFVFRFFGQLWNAKS
jgi:hypothetical protein